MTQRPARSRRGGRPRKRASARRSCGLSLYLRPDEMEQIRTAALIAHLPVSRYARQVLLRQPIQPPTVPEVNLATYGELCRQGNNLNQLLVLIHTHRAPIGLRRAVEELLALNREIKFRLLGRQPDDPVEEPADDS